MTDRDISRDLSTTLNRCELHILVKHAGDSGMTSQITIRNPATAIAPRKGERISLAEIEGWEGLRPMTTGIVTAVTHSIKGALRQDVTVHLQED